MEGSIHAEVLVESRFGDPRLSQHVGEGNFSAIVTFQSRSRFLVNTVGHPHASSMFQSQQTIERAVVFQLLHQHSFGCEPCTTPAKAMLGNNFSGGIDGRPKLSTVG